MLTSSGIRSYMHNRLLDNASKYEIFDELNYKLNDHRLAARYVRKMPYTRNQKWAAVLNKTLAALIIAEVLIKLVMYSNAAGEFAFYATVEHLNLFTLSSAFLLYLYFRYDCFLYKLFIIINILNLGTITIYDEYQGFWLFMDWSVLTVMSIIAFIILVKVYPHLIWKKKRHNKESKIAVR